MPALLLAQSSRQFSSLLFLLRSLFQDRKHTVVPKAAARRARLPNRVRNWASPIYSHCRCQAQGAAAASDLGMLDVWIPVDMLMRQRIASAADDEMPNNEVEVLDTTHQPRGARTVQSEPGMAVDSAPSDWMTVVRPQWTPRTSAGRAKLMTESNNWERAELERQLQRNRSRHHPKMPPSWRKSSKGWTRRLWRKHGMT